MIIYKKDRGVLRFSKQTIESTVRYSFYDVYEVRFLKIKVKLNKDPGKIIIKVKIAFSNTGKVAELAETIKSKIDNALRSSLGIEVAEINIDILGVKLNSEQTFDKYDNNESLGGMEE